MADDDVLSSLRAINEKTERAIIEMFGKIDNKYNPEAPEVEENGPEPSTNKNGPEAPELSDHDRIKQLEDDVAYLSAELASLRASVSVPPTKLAPEAPEAPDAIEATRTTCLKCDRSFMSRNEMMKHVYGNNCGGKGKERDGSGGKESTQGKTQELRNYGTRELV